MSLFQMQWQYEVNVFGLVAVTNKFLPTLLSNRGRLVIIGSLGAIVTPPNHGLYTGYAGCDSSNPPCTNGARVCCVYVL